jgi:hypothetical protein
VRDVAGAVVRHDAGDPDTSGEIPGDEPSKEGDGGGGSFVGQDLGIGKTRCVIDGDVDELPADTPPTLADVTGDAVADSFDAAKLLDVDVDEFSGSVSLVTVDGRLGVEVFEPGEACVSQDPGHGGGAGADSGGDLLAGPARSPQPQDFLHDERMGPSGRAEGPGAAIDQRRLASLSIAFLPFRSGSAVNSGRFGGAGRGHPGFHSLDHQESTGRASSGILVKLHLGSFAELVALDTSSLTEKSPGGQLPPGNNVLRVHT